MNLTDFIKKAIKEYEDSFSFGDQILYDMCKEYSAHNKKGIIMSKVWLIGRSYAVALERTQDKDRKDIYKELVSEERKKDFKEIDDKINTLSKINKKLEKAYEIDKLDNKSITDIIALHNKLVKIYKNVSGLNKISLASKYLHFHLPNLFYIYDSRAKTAIDNLIHKKNTQNVSKRKGKYAEFFNKVYTFQEKLKSITQEEYSPRDIDCILLHYHKIYLVDKKSKKDNDFKKIIKSIKLN